jgi:hypothetical protein
MSYTRQDVARAVQDEEWITFRVRLKGTSTRHKLQELRAYLESSTNQDRPARRIRVDNYLKALCRGGQLRAGTDLSCMESDNWDQYIKR